MYLPSVAFIYSVFLCPDSLKKEFGHIPLNSIFAQNKPTSLAEEQVVLYCKALKINMMFQKPSVAATAQPPSA